MIFLRSVVGKLWITILLLVSFILFILTVLLLQFFENNNNDETNKQLTETAMKIAHVLEKHEGAELPVGLEISWEIIDNVTKVVIIHDQDVYYSPNTNASNQLSVKQIKEDRELSKVLNEEKQVKKISNLSEKETARHWIIGVPFGRGNDHTGAVFVYQSLEVMKVTTRSTTKFILLVAGVAIILTTIFAFFLSTRITAPLRKMREAAFEVARGKFDTKVPILTNDEIGELATAFNQMGKQLQFNMNALSQEKEQLASILSSMADGVITFNRDGTILISNPPAERFLQYWYYANGEMSDNPEAVPSKVMDLFQLAVSTEKEQVGEVSLHGRYWVVIVSPLYSSRFIRGAVAVVRDMTEERQLDALRKDFIANVSHELRTPISMMQGYSEAIVDGIAETDEEKREMAQVIYDESLRMGRLVNELLDLARMEAGHIALTKEEMDVPNYIHRIIRKFQGLARDNEITISAGVNKEEFQLSFDPDRIEQVLTNLIDNAIRHTPKDGHVNVIVKDLDKGTLFEVQDSGSGIPEEDVPFVFERFYKADKARTRGRAGTGLGLAIAKNIVDAHHGHITVQSKLGQGTTFSFFLPRKSE
ncbi:MULTISPECIES: ATP-binding protein [unclassified Bacillus (in: firmicutes)]|uniref:ATP-binding protein n=1 Tax=unclassified Bacillus (in: firmicutes) TaxID=185979 RepID=UPI0008E67EDA|nr:MULTISPECIES: ATP-binding protein [unclassified Bacillus (in: firmicutes)]SFA98046.1 two-component system, OmpR family, sensor histidine kinase ResE [Bacillus sp. UNCCL13]SFQ80791.1 two-component system, OmpR family, sensor histidine kinase ResE [Bacillus sp. cl95]